MQKHFVRTIFLGCTQTVHLATGLCTGISVSAVLGFIRSGAERCVTSFSNRYAPIAAGYSSYSFAASSL